MIDPLRHLSVFSPEKFGETPVHVIGCGAIGSTIIFELAKLGVKNIHGWDFDRVEEHNLANQMFGPKLVGANKAVAIQEVVSDQCDMDITVHEEAVTGDTSLSGYVFIVTDTMASRKEIFENAIRYNPNVPCMIECRMGAEMGWVYSINPCHPTQIEGWMGSLYPDEEAEDSVCGSRTTVGATAKLLSSIAVWQYIKWQNGDDDIANQLLISLKPYLLQATTFTE
ncbi:MAG: ThiF family adenylyltransferase [Candidimonas sp.]